MLDVNEALNHAGFGKTRATRASARFAAHWSAVVAVASASLEREALSEAIPMRETMPMTLLAIARSSFTTPHKCWSSACERLRWGSLNRRKAG